MKLSGSGLLFVGRFFFLFFLNYWSIWLLVIGLFICPISFWFSLRKITFLRICPFLLGCSFNWEVVVLCSLSWLFVLLWCQLWLLLFHFWFYWFGPSSFFSWWLWLKAYQFSLSFQRSSFQFHWSFLFFFLVSILFLFQFLSFFSSTNFGFYLFSFL